MPGLRLKPRITEAHEYLCVLVVRHEDACAVQGLWKGVLPSLVMVANPTVNYMLYEVLLARLAELKRRRRGIPTGEHPSRADEKTKTIQGCSAMI